MSLTDERMEVQGSTTLKNTVIGSKTDEKFSTTNVISTINYILKEAGTGQGGGITKITSDDKSISITNEMGPTTNLGVDFGNAYIPHNFCYTAVTCTSDVLKNERYVGWIGPENFPDSQYLLSSTPMYFGYCEMGSGDDSVIGSGIIFPEGSTDRISYAFTSKAQGDATRLCLYWADCNYKYSWAPTPQSIRSRYYKTLNKKMFSRNWDVYSEQMEDFTIKKDSISNIKDLDWDWYANTLTHTPDGVSMYCAKTDINNLKVEGFNTHDIGIHKVTVTNPKTPLYPAIFFMEVVE